MISATSVLVGLGIYFVLRAAVREIFPVSAAIAFMFGLLVMAVDRWLIMTVVHHNNRARALMMSVPRLAFGLVLSLIISAPVILQIFQPNINDQLVIVELQQKSDFARQIDTSAINIQVDDERNAVNSLVGIISNSSGKEKAVEVSAAKSELPEAEQRLRDGEAQETELQNNFEAAESQDRGLLTQISVFIDVCDEDATLRNASILLFLFFAIISLLPIMMKIMLSRGPESAYDKASNFGDDEALRAAEIIQRLRMERRIHKEDY